MHIKENGVYIPGTNYCIPIESAPSFRIIPLQIIMLKITTLLSKSGT